MTKIRLTNVVFWIALIGTDILIYLFLGLLLMGYDDNYDDSKGEYWSLSSMTLKEKLLYFCYIGWIGLNVVGLIYLVVRAWKRRTHN